MTKRPAAVESERLLIRAPVEADRARFVELFLDPAFTVFANPEDDSSADERFERMLEFAAAVPYAKSPIVERSTGRIVGYTGVWREELFGLDRLEWGWRLEPSARGKGYATEAGLAWLQLADRTDDGEMVCIIDHENSPSRRVAVKLGFTHWCEYRWDGDPNRYELMVRPIGNGGRPLPNPLPEHGR